MRPARSEGVGLTLAVFSMGLGVVFALVAERLGDFGGTIATIVAWTAIVAVNYVHVRRR